MLMIINPHIDALLAFNAATNLSLKVASICKPNTLE